MRRDFRVTRALKKRRLGEAGIVCKVGFGAGGWEAEGHTELEETGGEVGSGAEVTEYASGVRGGHAGGVRWEGFGNIFLEVLVGRGTGADATGTEYGRCVKDGGSSTSRESCDDEAVIERSPEPRFR